MFEQIANFLSTTPIWSVEMLSVLIGVGAFVGFVNTIAGLATSISYALFMAMGMPINIANATTRFGVLAQFSVNSLIFKKKGYLDVSLATKVGIPVALGAFLGAELASKLPTNIIEITMGCMLPVMGVLLLIDKKKFTEKYKLTGSSKMSVWKYLIFFIIGIYGGFTHAGVGLLIMFGSFLFLGLDLVHSNAIKQLAVVIYTPIALVIFAYHGQINWPVALIYSIGNIIGGVAASMVAIRWGEKIIKICVLIVVLAMSAYLIAKQLI
ncbi:MAG: sulfite exporter TauE/SafE family protein [Bacteroidales bacterium]|nr:sulfite exporter TauE/SafE family protein [Bacteroidales bacterium]MDD4671048.1 sulfite exporter TauE/SafE family protein [Bacteroidales bacterium]